MCRLCPTSRPAHPITDSLLVDALDLDQIADEGARRAVRGLLNLVEDSAAENRALREDVRRRRDAIARLKGEPGKPVITPDTQPPLAADHSPKRERHTPAPWRKASKRPHLSITGSEVREVDPAVLPPAAEFNGYDEGVVQDVVLRTDTVLFRNAMWYAPSEGRPYLAPLPAGYAGQFGPGRGRWSWCWPTLA